MEINMGSYKIIFMDGGIEIQKSGTTLYFNRRPVYVSVKDEGGINRFRDIAYAEMSGNADAITGSALFETGNGSCLKFLDRYTMEGETLRIDRNVTVIRADERDLGFQTKVSLYLSQAENLADLEYFYPGQWYRDNRFAADYAMGKDLSLQYIWRKETYAGLPMFSARYADSGETVTFSRWAANATLPSLDRTTTENYAYVDPKMTVGSFGVSNAKPEALVYTYYGHMMKVPLENTQCDGPSIDYIYPAVNGQQPAGKRGPYNVDQPLTNVTWVHPMREGFSQSYSIAINFGCYEDFGGMMRNTWRLVWPRLKDRLFQVDNHLLYQNMMKLLKSVTKQFGNAWGTPFVAQLPDFDPNSFSAEIGFVGQQTGIGYQLIRYGTLHHDAEAFEKGKGIIHYWVNETMTNTGCPRVWMHLSAHQAEPQPQWIREIGDGLEGILDAWKFEHEHGNEHPDWLDYCISTADWLVARQETDGSFFRAYLYDNRPCMDSKASTPCVVRFLLQMYDVTEKKAYMDAAIKAGEWTYKNMYKGFEYRGGTCDQSDVMDKESGIYAMFAFTALYEATGEKRWLEAACGAADYTETFTFVWDFPVYVPYPKHPFNRNHISGQSQVTVGTGGGDIYMAACSYAYYKLYVLTGDEHYAELAEFLNLNCKQVNDVDGSCGYKYIGLVNEGGGFSEQEFRSRYHWLPWCTFVEVDPASRFQDTFGKDEVDVIRKIPPEEQARMVREHPYR